MLPAIPASPAPRPRPRVLGLRHRSDSRHSRHEGQSDAGRGGSSGPNAAATSQAATRSEACPPRLACMCRCDGFVCCPVPLSICSLSAACSSSPPLLVPRSAWLVALACVSCRSLVWVDARALAERRSRWNGGVTACGQRFCGQRTPLSGLQQRSSHAQKALQPQHQHTSSSNKVFKQAPVLFIERENTKFRRISSPSIRLKGLNLSRPSDASTQRV